ncbi:MAG: UDP-3-O-(3-hydroxymyristoyl)glucosamine N-acyltransferase [Bdellovibrionota bacterium]
MRISELAVFLSAELVNPPMCEDDDVFLRGVLPISEAKPGFLTFLTAKEYEKYLKQTQASAVILAHARDDIAIPQLVHADPYFAMAKAFQVLHKAESLAYSGISDRSEVHPSAEIGKDVVIFPFTFVGKNAVIGDESVLYPGVYIGEGSKIGKGSTLHANVVIGDRCVVGEHALIHAGTVLGADGFGFAPSRKHDEIVKIPQVGNVVLGDFVEIGSCCTIDRATMGSTSIGNGSKLDSHVHIGHNVKVGRNSMLCGGAKIAGSATIGDWCVLGGEASVSNHCVLSDGIRIGAKAGVTKNLTEPGDYMGFPAEAAGKWRRQVASSRRFSGFEKKFIQLTKELESLKAEVRGS